MGMYDNVKWEEKCPHCGNMVDDFQSKDGPCGMYMLDYWDVTNFYSGCNKCGTWIEYTKKRAKKIPLKHFKRTVRIEKNKQLIEDSKKFWEEINKK